MWTSYTLDPKAGELFVPVGNPAPDLAPDQRPGDNLFTNSIVVLDAKTGTLKNGGTRRRRGMVSTTTLGRRPCSTPPLTASRGLPPGARMGMCTS